VEHKNTNAEKESGKNVADVALVYIFIFIIIIIILFIIEYCDFVEFLIKYAIYIQYLSATFIATFAQH